MKSRIKSCVRWLNEENTLMLIGLCALTFPVLMPAGIVYGTIYGIASLWRRLSRWSELTS